MDTSGVFDQRASIYEGSQQSVRSELNLGEIPITDISTEYSSEYLSVYPTLSIRDSNPIEFLISSESNYLNLFNSQLFLTCRILNQDGSNLGTNDHVVPCSNFFSNLWSNVEVYLNGVLVSDAANFYSTIGNIHRLLSTSPLQKQNELQNELWYPDDVAGTFNLGTNKGMAKRYEYCKKSEPFPVMGKLIANVFNCVRWFPCGTEVRVVLRKNLPELCLDCATDTKTGVNGCPYKVSIDNAVLYVERKVVPKTIIDMHRSLLSQGKTLKFPTTELEVKVFTLPSGITSQTLDNVIMGKIPKMIVFGLVDNEGYLGKLSKCPFQFVDKQLCELNLSWNTDNMEYRSMPLSFKNGATGEDSFIQALESLRKCASNWELGNGLNRTNYTNGKR